MNIFTEKHINDKNKLYKNIVSLLQDAIVQVPHQEQAGQIRPLGHRILLQEKDRFLIVEVLTFLSKGHFSLNVISCTASTGYDQQKQSHPSPRK